MKKTSLLFLILSIPFLSKSQYSDFGSWISASAEKEVVDDLDFQGTLELRSDLQFLEVESYFSDLSLTYRFDKHFRVSGTYRIGTRRNDEGNYNLRHRGAFDLVLRERKWKTTFGYRFRYQIGQNGIASGEEFIEFSDAMRHKIQAERKIAKRTFAQLSGELFFKRHDQGFYPLTDFRLNLDVERRIAKRKYLTVGIVFQQAINTQVAENEYILKVGYSMELKGRKKGKDEDQSIPDPE